MSAKYLISSVLVIVVLITNPCFAVAQAQPSGEPILRVETGTHGAPIKRAATDAAGRLLATASWDKTVRLWSLDAGDLIRILRPPIGDGSEGKVYAVAVSPDGKWVAAGGWTGHQWNKSYSVYVFEAESGR